MVRSINSIEMTGHMELIAKRSLIWVLCGLIAAPIAAIGQSAGLDEPTGRMILEVDGAIERTTDGTTARFDLDQLEALGLTEISTESPWTDGMATFQGVKLSALMEHLDASGEVVHFLALDDYAVSIPVDDFAKYEPILATRRDGEPMRIRDKGPIWVIYPWSEFPEIQNEENYAKAIWQVFQMSFD